MAEEIGLKGTPIIQYCKGMNSTFKTNMELTELRIRGLKESDSFHLKNVRVTDNVPELPESLPTELNIDSYENFSNIMYPIVDHERCDMLLGSDNINLFVPPEGTVICMLRTHASSESLRDACPMRRAMPHAVT